MCPHAQIQERNRIRCVLVHDLALLRQGLRRLLEDEPDLVVVAEAENAAQALRAIFEHQPHAVIADVNTFACEPDQAAQMILQESPATSVIFLPHSKQEEPVATASHNSQHVLRQTSAGDLVTMLRASAGAQPPIPAGSRVSEFPEVSSGRRGLTAREREVLKLLAEGRTVRSVAGFLGLSVKTVDAHKFNLMRKLGIHNKAELVMWAIQKKVVKLPVNF